MQLGDDFGECGGTGKHARIQDLLEDPVVSEALQSNRLCIGCFLCHIVPLFFISLLLEHCNR